MSFEENRGQTDRRVRFLARGKGYMLFLTADAAVFRLDDGDRGSASIEMSLVGARPAKRIAGTDTLPQRSHYFRGGDARRSTTDVPSFAKVRYEEIYRGVDLVYYGNQQQLEYDFVVAPGGDASAIQLAFAGAEEVRLATDGDLLIRLGHREIRQRKPFAYQKVDGVRQEVAARYVVEPSGGIGIRLAEYDTRRTLTIDPVLLYSTYLGGDGEFFGAAAIAVDSSGAAYIAGSTTSPEFPTTPGAFRETNNGGSTVCGFCDAFVTKFDPAGALVYSTYLGGDGSNGITGIAVSPAGEAYVVGTSTAVDFPTTPGAFQTTCTQFGVGVPAAGTCNAGFVANLNATGSALGWSTYLGGAGVTVTGYGTYVSGIALDADLNIFLTGATSPEFPITPGAFQTEYAGSYLTGYVAKMNPAGSALLYASYLGGHQADAPTSIAVDGDGNAYVTGLARSPDFPTTSGAFQRTCPTVEIVGGCSIAFVTKVNSTASAIVYSTLLGGWRTTGPALNGLSSEGRDIAVDQQGFAYVTGESTTLDFPTTPGSFKPTATTWEPFVTKVNLDGTGLVYSTLLGGDVQAPGGFQYETGVSILVDAAGNAYVAGITSAVDFPVVDPLQATFGGYSWDVFVLQLSPSGSALVFSTFLGGSGSDDATALARDEQQNLIVAGTTRSPDFPLVNPAQGTLPGSKASFVAKIGEPICGADVTGRVTVFQSAIVPFFWPFNLQLAIVWNSSSSPVSGPLAYVMDDLQNAVFVGLSTTRCFSPDGDPLTLVPLGGDNVLAPNEAALMGLWFYQTQLAPISYTPRLLSGPRNR